MSEGLTLCEEYAHAGGTLGEKCETLILKRGQEVPCGSEVIRYCEHGIPYVRCAKHTREYELYCGAFDCPTRLRLELHVVAEADLPDGEVWYCPACRDDPIAVTG